jgi:hypothetical protein
LSTSGPPNSVIWIARISGQASGGSMGAWRVL